MERIIRNVLVVFLLMISGYQVHCLAAVSGSIESEEAASTTEDSAIDWEPVMNAIIAVESGGNNHAKSGSSVGCMQITPVLVAQCNLILKSRKSKKRYRLSDRFSRAMSKEMFLLIQSFYNPLNSIERAIRSWNGGPHYGVKSTQHYLEKVLRAMKSL